MSHLQHQSNTLFLWTIDERNTIVLIHTMLNKQPMHGYEIIKVIESSSNWAFLLKEGTIYPILHTLEAEEMLEFFRGEGKGERKRKFYKITTKGQQQLLRKKDE